MDWKQLLASITGTADQALLVRHAYLVTDNRILHNQINGRVHCNDGERKALAEIAQQCDGSPQRKPPGRPTIAQELEALVVRLAHENRSWGDDRIVGGLANLGSTISAQTVGNLLKRHGIAPAPERKTTTTWKACIRTHLDVLVAPDFFTAEVWTLGGLVTYSVLLFIHLGSRKVQVAGVSRHPNEAWMVQVTRNVTMAEWGLLSPGPYRIHDRDTKFCAALQQSIDDAGVERVVLPPQSPHLNASAERWRRSAKDEALSRRMLCGEDSRRHVLSASMDHDHQQRNHQGKGYVVLLPQPRPEGRHDGPMQSRERLGGLLTYDERQAA
jgi:putative transposase